MVWSFDPSIHKRLERILARSQDPILANKVSVMIDQQERNKVQTMMITSRSVAVRLLIDVPECDMTANDVLQNTHGMYRKPCHNFRVM